MRKNTPKDSIVVEANWRNNKYFPKPLMEDMERDRRLDPIKASHIWDGDYQSVTGGSYYSLLLLDCKRAGRITEVNYEPDIPVSVSWDLGIGDSMSLVLWQQTPESLRIIDHYENHSQPLPHYIDWLQAKEYEGNYSIDWLPHDAKVRELGTGLTRVETMRQYKSEIHPNAQKRNPKIVPNHRIEDGINAVRELLPQMWFDAEKCEYLLECLAQYREDFSSKLLTLTSKPLHDWTSHSADAIRYGCMAFKDLKMKTKVTEPRKFDMSLNKPPTLDELWDQHNSYESIGDW
jgi:phage terminase large subunit